MLLRHRFLLYNLLLCTIFAIFFALAFYPGFMSPDSYSQLSQAISGKFSDWHPPIMALTWSIMLSIFDYYTSYYILQISFFWVAIFMLSYIVWLDNPKLSTLIIGVAFLPFVVNFVPTIWKDVGLAVSWLLFIEIILLSRKNKIIDWPIRSTAWLLFLYGILVRSNTVLAAGPLLIWSLGYWQISTVRKIIIILLATPLLYILSVAFNNHIVGAKDDRAIDSIFWFDLGGISYFSKENQFPGQWTEEETERITGPCYNESQWGSYVWGECSFVRTKVDQLDDADKKSYRSLWLKAISEHPISYIQHRTTHFNDFLRFWGTSDSYYILQYGTIHQSYTDTELGLDFRPNYVTNVFAAYILGQSNMFWFKPYFWLALSIAILILVYRRSEEECCFAGALSASSVLYIFPYLIVGAASDFRYVYWPILATVASIVVLATSAGRFETPFARRALVRAGGLLAAVTFFAEVVV